MADAALAQHGTTHPEHSRLPWAADPRAQALLTYLQIAYPIILLILFIVAFTVRGVLTARADYVEAEAAAAAENSHQNHHQPEHLGPGGKPLPRKNKRNAAAEAEASALDFSRARKVLFQSLQAGVLLTLCGNIALVVVHALVAREERWWCGQAPTVRIYQGRISSRRGEIVARVVA